MPFGNLNDDNDPLSVVQRMQQGQSAGQASRQTQSSFPAVNQITNPKNTAFARNAPINTIAQNLQPAGSYQPGSIYGGIKGSSVPQFTNPYAALFNQFTQGRQQSSAPTMTGYHWWKGTGGVSGGNNDTLHQFYSDGTTKSFTGGVQDNQPLASTIWTQPGVGGTDVRALSDPSVGALENATRTTNQYGQQVISTSGNGQIISGKAGSPSFGSLQGSTPAVDAQGRPGLNTPSGGTAIGGRSLRKPMDKLTPGQTWSLGGWY